MFLEHIFVHSALLYLYVLDFLWFQGYMSTAQTSLLLKPNLCNEELPVVWVMTVSSVYLFCCVGVVCDGHVEEVNWFIFQTLWHQMTHILLHMRWEFAYDAAYVQ